MWIFTDSGFISAVRKKDRPDVITVRSRDHESLEALTSVTGDEITQSRHGDYPYRAFVHPDAFTQWVTGASQSIHYDNFKSRVSHTRGYHYTHALHDVWAAMLNTEDDNARQ
jgi:hypothetical protein